MLIHSCGENTAMESCLLFVAHLLLSGVVWQSVSSAEVQLEGQELMVTAGYGSRVAYTCFGSGVNSFLWIHSEMYGIEWNHYLDEDGVWYSTISIDATAANRRASATCWGKRGPQDGGNFLVKNFTTRIEDIAAPPNLGVTKASPSGLHLSWDILPLLNYTDSNSSVLVDPKITDYRVVINDSQSLVTATVRSNEYVYRAPESSSPCDIVMFQVSAKNRFSNGMRSATEWLCPPKAPVFQVEQVKAYLKDGIPQINIMVDASCYCEFPTFIKVELQVLVPNYQFMSHNYSLNVTRDSQLPNNITFSIPTVHINSISDAVLSITIESPAGVSPSIDNITFIQDMEINETTVSTTSFPESPAPTVSKPSSTLAIIAGSATGGMVLFIGAVAAIALSAVLLRKHRRRSSNVQVNLENVYEEILSTGSEYEEIKCPEVSFHIESCPAYEGLRNY